MLKSYVNSGFAVFNWEGDSKVFTQDELKDFIEHYQKDGDPSARLKFLIPKLQCTLSRLASELMLKDDHNVVCYDGLEAHLDACNFLFEAHTATLRLLNRIKAREDLIETLAKSGAGQESLPPKQQKRLKSLNSEILGLIEAWLQLKLPYSSFVYQGEDFSVRLRSDMAKLKPLTRLKLRDPFEVDVDIRQADLRQR